MKYAALAFLVCGAAIGLTGAPSAAAAAPGTGVSGGRPADSGLAGQARGSENSALRDAAPAPNRPGGSTPAISQAETPSLSRSGPFLGLKPPQCDSAIHPELACPAGTVPVPGATAGETAVARTQAG